MWKVDFRETALALGVRVRAGLAGPDTIPAQETHMALLVVEDDAAIARPLIRALEREGFVVDHVECGQAALVRAADDGVDLVLLDLTLPDIDGLEVCRRIREAHPQLPVVMLTARGEEVDLVVGFDAGADDYVTKPFRVAELVARLRARLRAAPAPPLNGASRGQLATAGVRVDLDAHRAWLGDRELDLTPKEFDLLALLVGEAGKTLRREHIMSAVWDEHWWGSTRTLDMHVSALRRKLDDDPTRPGLITTVRGVGFRFEAAAAERG
jgi:DNA-binding response OmpR family regulator